MAKIMLVEDDNNLREIYEARLMAEGYEIVTARDGEEALAVAVKERPDLIISDVMMPKISGFDMLDILRSTPETKHAKVIMMTALSQTEDKERASKLGADRYLVKSQVTLEDVAKVAREVLEGTASPEQPNTATQTSPVSTSQTPDLAAEPVAPAAPTAVPTPPAPAQDNTVVPAPIATTPAPTNEDVGTAIPVTVVTASPAPTEPVITPQVAPAAPTAVPTPPAQDDTVVTAPTVVATTPGGITDLTAPADAEPAEPLVSPEPAAPTPTAQAWSANELDEQKSVEQPNADVARAEAVVSESPIQTLEDEEAAIAKQIESAMATAPSLNDQPAAPADTPPAQTESQDTPATTTTDSPVNSDSDPAPTEPVSTPKTAAGQKVIQPISDISKPVTPSLEELAKKEEELEQAKAAAGQAPAATTSESPLTPPVAESSDDPNAMAL